MKSKIRTHFPRLQYLLFHISQSRIGVFGGNLQYVGILLFAAGIAFREGLFGTWQHFIVRVQVREEARLVTWGPYSHIRHPSYTGSWLIYDGNITGGWDLVWALFTLALTLIAYGYRINIEEQALQEAFGSEWDDHKKRTWKRIPGF